MNLEQKLAISILSLTRNGPVSVKIAGKHARIPSGTAQDLIKRLYENGLIYLRNNLVIMDRLKRIRMAVRVIESGADLERVSSLLDWKEFEGIAAIAFQRNNYTVRRNLRFARTGRRWEIDVVGCKKPIVVCVDCKHWHQTIYASALRKIVEEQIRRTAALAESFPTLCEKLECGSWTKAKLIPAIVSLVETRSKLHSSVPIVPVLQLQDFIQQLPIFAGSLRHFLLPNEP